MKLINRTGRSYTFTLVTKRQELNDRYGNKTSKPILFEKVALPNANPVDVTAAQLKELENVQSFKALCDDKLIEVHKEPANKKKPADK